MVVRVSLDGEISAEAWAQTQVQAKRKAALRLLLELGCPLEEAEDRAGTVFFLWSRISPHLTAGKCFMRFR